MTILRFVCGVGLILAMASPSWGAPTVNRNFFNMFTNAPEDQPRGYVDNVTLTANGSIFSKDSVEDAFGNQNGKYEPETFIFLDNDDGTKDNGDAVIGNGGETVDRLHWELVDTDILTTPKRQLALISGYEVRLDSDGQANNFNRGTEMFEFSSQGEVDDVFDNNAATGPQVREFIPQLSRSYDVRLTRTTALGSRITEIDAILPPNFPNNVYVDTVLFNAASLGPADETAGTGGPGLSTNIVVSSSIAGSKAEDAFGGLLSTIEPGAFIFGDTPNGKGDDRDNLLEPGIETIDSISWHTTKMVSIWGYEINLGPDSVNGVESPNRGADLVAFYIENQLVDLIDFNAFGAGLNRFIGKKYSGDDFRLEFTRRVGTAGVRLYEVNAIVPETNSLTMLLSAGFLFVAGYNWSRRRMQS